MKFDVFSVKISQNNNFVSVSIGRHLKLQAVTKQALAKGRPTSVTLAPIPNNLLNEYQIGEEASKEEAQIITFRAAAASYEDSNFFVVNDFTKFFHRILERISYSLHSDLDSCLLEKVRQALLHPSDAFNYKRVMSPG